MRHALAIVALAVAAGAQAANPVAFVADLKGNAMIEGNGKVVFLAELAPDTRLLLGTGASVAITYASTGDEFTIAGPGEFLVSAKEVRTEKGAAPTRRRVVSLIDPGTVARVSRTATASLRMRSLATGPADRKAALQYPVDTRVASLQPELRWHGAAPGDAVTVTLLDASGKELWKGSAQAPAARPAVKLSPATAYRWTVMSPQGALGEARFETLPAASVTKAEKSRAAAKTFSERVMHALLLQDIGAPQDARVAWSALAAERPDLPELAALAR
jgi:hypothetical protein